MAQFIPPIYTGFPVLMLSVQVQQLLLVLMLNCSCYMLNSSCHLGPESSTACTSSDESSVRSE